MSESPVDTIKGAADDSGPIANAVPATPGALLSATRQGHGLTIEQVASHLNLAPRQVVALEADDFAALPGMVIARGFLRSYAKLLRLDPVALLAMLGEQHQPSSSMPMRHALSGSFSESRLPSQASPGSRGRAVPIAAGIALLVAAAAGSYALGWWPEGLSRRVTQLRLSAWPTGENAVAGNAVLSEAGANTVRAGGVAAVSQAGQVGGLAGAPVQSAQATGTPMLTATRTLASTTPGTRGDMAPSRATATGRARVAAVAPADVGQMTALTPSSGLNLARQATVAVKLAATQNPLVLNIQEDSWVELKRADNTPVVAKVIKAGSVETFDVSEPLTLIVGNIAGVEASLRGTPIALASAATGNVARVLIK